MFIRYMYIICCRTDLEVAEAVLYSSEFLVMAVILISHTAEFSMMIEVLIYPAVAVLAILFLYITLGPREEVIRSVTHDMAINIDKCASEHCVR